MVKPTQKTIIVSRRLMFGSKRIRGVIYQPSRMTTPPRDWIAEFEILGLDEQTLDRAIGVDEMQAMLLATQGLRLRLEALGPELHFLGRAGDSGIPRLITTSYGLEFAQRAEQLVDDEAARFVEAAMSERKKAKKRRRKTG